MHPFARARERTRALNAAKMDRIFAKPFVDSLEGHIDAVEVLCRKPESLTTVASGSWDGGMFCYRTSETTLYMLLCVAQELSCTICRNGLSWLEYREPIKAKCRVFALQVQIGC